MPSIPTHEIRSSCCSSTGIYSCLKKCPAIFLLLFGTTLVSTVGTSQSVELQHQLDQVTQTEDPFAKCGDTTNVPYLPGYDQYREKRKMVQSSDVKDRCEHAETLGDRLLITTTHTGDVAWMLNDLNIPFIVYHSKADNASHHHPNVGLEAMGYLTFIAEYYNCLPKVALFVHPHKSSYHTYHALDVALKLVNWKNITGYATAHPFGAAWANFSTHNPNVNLKPVSLDSMRTVPDCHYVINGTLYEYWSRWEYSRSQWLSKAFDDFFSSAGLGPLPQQIRCATTAEFFVTKERIRLQSRQFYMEARAWIIEAEKKQLMNSWELAVTFELLWHYIFGEPAVMLGPSLKPCDLYRCAKPTASSQ